ncbi:hypothetical protein [Streptomyces sp. NPDC058398]|uniref:hypothetical protein n=1 Tax=Streptomyces sp. NPDC058398 TaxID=3346479 RepID=UPI00364C6D63
MSDERDGGGPVMSGTTTWIATGWLLAFGAVDAGLYAAWSRRTRDERRFLRGVRAADLDPILAAWWLGASWEGAPAQQETYAVEVATSLLILAGDAEIDNGGRITVPHTRFRDQKDPVLAALMRLVHLHKGATVDVLLTDPRFQRFRTVLRTRRAPLRSRFGSSRFPALTAAFVTAFGMSMHAMIMRCAVPGLPDRDPGWWTMAWIPLWAVLAAVAAIWPQEMARPWPRFTRRCRTAVTRALADQSSETRFRVSISASGPSGRRPPDGTAVARPRVTARAIGRTPPSYDLDPDPATGPDAHHHGPDSGDFGGGD